MNSLIIGLIGLSVAVLCSFIVAFRNTKWILIILIPIVTTFGLTATLSYKNLLGLPVNMKWEEMPNDLKIIFFKIEDKNSIIIWIEEDGKSKIVRLPNIEGAKEILNKNKKGMKSGGALTLERVKQEDGGSLKVFPYKFKSIGDVVPGSLPPK